jgi:hypothetical protein
MSNLVAQRSSAKKKTVTIDPLRRLKAGTLACTLPCLRLVYSVAGGNPRHREALQAAEDAIFDAWDTYDRKSNKTLWRHARPFVVDALKGWAGAL